MGNRFRFRFVFVSRVRASGRGEAAWACERGVFVNAGLQNGEKSSGVGRPFCMFAVFLHSCWFFIEIIAMCVGLLLFVFLMLGTLVF